jgi:hypothetical protein
MRIRRGARASDGVAHTAFIHDFASFLHSCEADKRAIETMGEVLAGSNGPLVVSAGTLAIRPGPSCFNECILYRLARLDVMQVTWRALSEMTDSLK